MALSYLHGSFLANSYLEWVELSLSVVDQDPDDNLYLVPIGGGDRISGVRPFSSSAETIRLPRLLMPQITSLVGVRFDQSMAYIALAIDLDNDVEVTLIAVDESGGSGGGTVDQAHIQGTVTIDGVAVSRQIVIVDDDPSGRKVVGAGQSATDGTFDIAYDDTGFPVIALALDEYGDEFATETALNQGAIVHPATPNGYVYEVSVAGTTGTTEPTWSTSTSVQSGDVTFTPRPYYRPIASGPLQGEPVV